jgi:protein tyrosine/serine phosphatase
MINYKLKKQKTILMYSIIIVSLALILSACKCPSLTYTGKYALDIITLKNTHVRTIDNPAWANKMDLDGLPNLHKVSDMLYRGAQPTAEGIKELDKLGIKTIVNLRSDHSDLDDMKNSGIHYEEIRMTASNPKTDYVIRFLKIISDSNNAPVFVHCRQGADRTGMICAIYRIFFQGWNKEDAIEEMTEGGYGFHSIWTNLADFIRALNIEEIKQKAGLKE